jgi:hypothetical protein
MNLFEKVFGEKLAKRVGVKHSTNPSFAAPEENGAIAIDGSSFGVSHFDVGVKWKTSADLIKQYRNISKSPEAHIAIDDIVNEAIVFDNEEESVTINLSSLDANDAVKEKMTEEFFTILKRLNFNYDGDEIFRSWYIDGRKFYHIIVDEGNLKKGIKELREIDPTKIQLIKEIKKEKDTEGNEFVTDVIEYYLYSENIGEFTKQIRIDPDSVIYCDSGIFDEDTGQALSYLHKAIKPLNMLNMLEDATMVYRVTRAPEKRVFYIDTGELPKTRAEQYIKNIMAKYKNKMVYDSTTGTIQGNQHTVSMMEDYWIPRRGGTSSTEIDTLPGAASDTGIDELLYFRKNLYKSLHVPISRLESESTYSFGRQSEINRDEVKFSKFIQKLRKKFSLIFFKALRTQLILKGVINKNEWATIKESINFDFNDDSFFVELKDNEILKERVEMLSDISEYVGKYYSHDYVRTKILRQNEEEMKEIDSQIKEEKNNEQYKDDEDGYN